MVFYYKYDRIVFKLLNKVIVVYVELTFIYIKCSSLEKPFLKCIWGLFWSRKALRLKDCFKNRCSGSSLINFGINEEAKRLGGVEDLGRIEDLGGAKCPSSLSKLLEVRKIAIRQRRILAVL